MKHPGIVLLPVVLALAILSTALAVDVQQAEGARVGLHSCGDVVVVVVVVRFGCCARAALICHPETSRDGAGDEKPRLHEESRHRPASALARRGLLVFCGSRLASPARARPTCGHPSTRWPTGETARSSKL